MKSKRCFWGIAGALLALWGVYALAEPPGWWSERDAVASDDNATAVATQGQAKRMAQAAYQEFEEMLAPMGGAGEAITNLVKSPWFTDTSTNRAVCVQGQAKTLAAPFYTRLDELGMRIANSDGGALPWSKTTDDDEAEAPITIGQLKYLFGFDLDTDRDRIPDWWENELLGDLESDPSGDHDMDGVSLLDEWKKGLDPNVADSDGDGTSDNGEDVAPVAPRKRGLSLATPRAESREQVERRRTLIDHVRKAAGLAPLFESSVEEGGTR